MPMEASRVRSKRGSSEVDDCDECLPISKRINRLHIEGQQKRNDEQFGCTHQQQPSNGHGMNNNSQPSASWQNGMVQQSDSLPSQDYLSASLSERLVNDAPQYPNQVAQSSMYQAMPGGPRNGFITNHCPGPGFPVQQQFSQQNPVMNMASQFAQNTNQAIPEEEEATDSMDYDPELDEGENPHYYHINHLLFNAHCQRMRRGGFSIDPGDPGSFP